MRLRLEIALNAAVSILILIVGCGKSTSPNATTTVGSAPHGQAAAAPIPSHVSYKIVDQHMVPGSTRRLQIRLNKKVTEDVLKSIALQLKNSDTNTYKRTFIFYLLPDMEIGAGCWATTHFNPQLEVKFVGATVEHEMAFKNRPDAPGQEILGKWFCDELYLPRGIIIFRQARKLYLERTWKDGSTGKDEIVERKSPFGRRFDKVGASDDDFWVLDADGNLQIRDAEGVILTAKKIK